MSAENHCGCQEYETLSRRRFLDTSGMAAAALLSAPAWLPKVVLGQDENSARDVLIVVFLRGGMDGVTAVVPHGDPNLYAAGLRPNIGIMPPDAAGGAIDLDGFFGLAPALADLKEIYDAGDLAIVHATGSPDPTRSHFEAFKVMEYGTPLAVDTLFTGWIARHLDVMPAVSDKGLRAAAMADVLPRMLAGAPAAVPVADPQEFDIRGFEETVDQRKELLDLLYQSADATLTDTASSTIKTIDLLKTIDFANYTPSGGAAYPATHFGRAAKSAAALIKADVGVEVVTLERDGWDTHNEQGVFEGRMFDLMTDLNGVLHSLYLDLQQRMNNITIMVMSEFGRRIDENGSLGTDHGHGNCSFVIGGNVAGGQVIADWTSGELLHPDLRYKGDSLEVTIDYRDVVAEVLEKRLNNTELSSVFPNHTATFPGVIA